MFSKIMDRFYYGKSGKADYTHADLPKNRIDLFFTTLKVRWSSMAMLNLVYALFWLPAFMIVMGAVSQWLNALNSVQALIEESQILAEESIAIVQSFQNSLLLQTLLKLIPAIFITGPASVGLAYNLRNWARDEHAFIWSDAWDSIKSNWKQALGISAISSVLPAILYISFRFYGDLGKNNMLMLLPQVLVVLAGIAWVLGSVFFYYLIVNYKLRFADVLRNGLLLSIARLPQVVGVKLLQAIPMLITILIAALSNIQYAIVFFSLYYAVFGLVLSRFIAASFSNACFENIINPRIEGAPSNIGLRSKEYADLEEELDKNDTDNDVYINLEDEQ